MSTSSNLAIVFPGQGSQSIGMSDKLATVYPEVKTIFCQASDVLGYDLWDKVTNGPESELNKTEITQPALLVAGFVTWTIWKERSSVIPSLLAGHSLGEYTALLCANVMSFTDAVELVAERGKCMQKAVPAGVGAMAAILGLENNQVETVCNEAAGDEIVSAANFNSPGQVVIAGQKQAVERAIELAKSTGAKRAILLPVSVPSHCMLMKSAADEFANVLNKIEFNDATIPVVQNVDAQAKTNAKEIRSCLLEQLYKPVRWVDVIKSMQQQHIQKIIECGPGKVLAGLIKRIDRSIDVHCVQDDDSLLKALGN